jgi:lipopolysaccharide biosynthesis protein
LCAGAHPGIALGFDAAALRPSSSRPTSLKAGVVLHLHFTEVWPDIEASLRCIPQPFGLIVTLTAPDATMEGIIREAFPQADIRTVPNSGRDIRPFLALLDAGALDQFDIVCKIHGKKSLRNGRPTALGDLWRRSALHDLIAGPRRLDDILERFESDPSLGMLGPGRFRVPNARFSPHDAWSGNRSETMRMAARLGLPAGFELDFFAGSMFWVRPRALAPLRGAGLGDPMAYAPEAGMTDGAVEHALERLFAAAAMASGFKIAEASPLPDARS